MATRQVLGGWADTVSPSVELPGSPTLVSLFGPSTCTLQYVCAVTGVEMLVLHSVILLAPGSSKQSHTVLAQQIRPNEESSRACCTCRSCNHSPLLMFMYSCQQCTERTYTLNRCSQLWLSLRSPLSQAH
jgi:hypothetical protein